MPDFKIKFAAHSNADLLKIIASPSMYQPQAIEAAKAILAERNLSDDEITAARSEAAAQAKTAEKTAENNFENQVKNMGNFIINNLNFADKDADALGKIILSSSVLLAFFALLQIYNNVGLVIFMVKSGDILSLIFTLAPLLFLPIATVLFYQRKTLGWILLGIYSTCLCLLSAELCIKSFRTSNIGSSAFDGLMPKNIFQIALFETLLFGGLLLLISQASMRNIYGIDKMTLWKTIGFTMLGLALCANFLHF